MAVAYLNYGSVPGNLSRTSHTKTPRFRSSIFFLRIFCVCLFSCGCRRNFLLVIPNFLRLFWQLLLQFGDTFRASIIFAPIFINEHIKPIAFFKGGFMYFCLSWLFSLLDFVRIALSRLWLLLLFLLLYWDWKMLRNSLWPMFLLSFFNLFFIYMW